MSEASRKLQAALEEALPTLRSLSEPEADRARAPGKWTRKEILGHLIDSAFNNHQRFVRAQQADRYVGPGYDQNAWVSLQGYRERSWSDLLALWEAANRHLVHVMARVRPERLGGECVVGDDPPATLDWWMNDYTRHLRHHLAQIFEGPAS